MKEVRITTWVASRGSCSNLFSCRNWMPELGLTLNCSAPLMSSFFLYLMSARCWCVGTSALVSKRLRRAAGGRSVCRGTISFSSSTHVSHVKSFKFTTFFVTDERRIFRLVYRHFLLRLGLVSWSTTAASNEIGWFIFRFFIIRRFLYFDLIFWFIQIKTSFCGLWFVFTWTQRELYWLNDLCVSFSIKKSDCWKVKSTCWIELVSLAPIDTETEQLASMASTTISSVSNDSRCVAKMPDTGWTFLASCWIRFSNRSGAWQSQS